MIHSKWLATWGVCFVLVFLCLSVFGLTPASAGVITVTTTADEDVENGECSLKEAIKAANADSEYLDCPAGSGVDLIILPEGVYTTTQLPFITTAMTIAGDGLSKTIIQASACNPVTEACTHTGLLFWVADEWGELRLEALTLRHGRVESSSYGGAIYNAGDVRLSNTAVYGNLGIQGGAILNAGTGNVTIENSTLYQNKADNGGAVFNIGDLTVQGSTFQGNIAENAAAIRNDGELTITNSTFSGNMADDRAAGIDNHGAATLINTTFSGNTGTQGVGFYNGLTGTLDIINTIIANSSGGGSDCENVGTIEVYGATIIEDGTCDAIVDGDPLLGPLAANGGPTQTHALLEGSPAIDSGSSTSCPLTDQRGVSRPQGEDCDIGAFELVPAVADFSATPLTGLIPLEVAFTNSSTGDFNSCSWDFGDGNTSSLCDPTPHTYIEPGIYTVVLAVSGLGEGDTESKTDYITVEGYKNFLPIMTK